MGSVTHIRETCKWVLFLRKNRQRRPRLPTPYRSEVRPRPHICKSRAATSLLCAPTCTSLAPKLFVRNSLWASIYGLILLSGKQVANIPVIPGRSVDQGSAGLGWNQTLIRSPSAHGTGPSRTYAGVAIAGRVSGRATLARDEETFPPYCAPWGSANRKRMS